ncbi:hypothetical protein BDY19DRAFT_993275 [Irpex rosettiformis]|uniref:Uncharacterized protein n=1 Tax=Irpex rosettiformis TaxID=378272 RepID=A0ACB8U408_9APHY|nr:hypothetical protein BDY19DRAFT_993275 [Irpex rosettiformis]
MQFRPAVLQLSRVPTAIASSPDGSCLLTVEPSDSGSYGPILRMYHWVSFGSTPGIVLEAQGFASDSAILTSFVKPSLVYCLWLDLSAHHLRSLALNISHKVTALSFQEDNVGTRNGTAKKRTVHNCLVDCHTDVWTKFPVVPAVARQTVKSSSARQHKSLVYVSALQPHLFPKHHNELIASFEKTTRKPVDNQLSQVNVTGMTFAAYMKHYMKPSTFCAGEWLVEILCLIPIHIAIARDNRFIPLKDGIFSMDSERSLLGATVEQIADRLSFGWYESIFQSYMASKPVKVVSSMGEQSVGKSYMLNHLVDTSFAGSAMRTTEGVWMSVTPTNEELIVALDFEGVHSIERSVQEDCLLVLFNTALSNLVLFRNNYAFSRDITGLFQSFQSSSIVLDPAANPTLFQSSLVVIIKDVPDSDKHEIKNEFQLKFSHIVEVEGEANFLSRLHGDAVLIVPWPVIESRQFYTLFPQLKKLLDKQTITHPKAGIFLQTVKMLMAKLKANDWGSIDQSMASHRVRQLFDILPTAMKHGATEIEHGFEPLRDIDNGQEISIADTDVSFQIDYLTSTEESYQMLDVLQQSWPRFPSRHEAEEEDWVLGLGNYLLQLADDRTTHVQEWLTTNTSRFGNDTADFASLHREFEALAVALKAGVILCQLNITEDNMIVAQTMSALMTAITSRNMISTFLAVFRHVQQLHETSHGSMSRTRWAVEDNSSVEVNGRRFGTNDDGAPMMVNKLGSASHSMLLKRYAVFDGADLQHISSPMAPEPNRAKDFVSHSLHWARLGFKDPYTQEEQLDFTLCDALCAGTEHQASVDGAPISPPSFCTLPLFHPHHWPAEPVQGTAVQGYISHDGHHFGCTDPSRLQQTYHIIFVIDRSSSMSNTDRRPLEATPMTARIAERHNNRLGAVYQSLFGFWSARQGLGHGPRQDAYSVILFNQHVHHAVIHDTTSTAEELLNNILRYEPGFGTNFTLAIEAGQARMEDQWDNDRASVMIFLSDGECRLPERRISQLCRRAVNLGRPLSFHAVSFGPFSHTLQGMVRIATQTQNSAPHNPLRPTVPSSYHEALDTVQLAETFLGIAESLRKTRGALMWM